MPGTSEIPPAFADLWAAGWGRQNAAYTAIMQATSRPAPWAHEVWDDVVANPWPCR